MSDEVWVVFEDDPDGKTTIWRVFSNPEAANNYVEDPDNLGYLYVQHCEVDEAWENTDE